MKKILSLITVLLFTVVFLFTLSACEKSLSGVYVNEEAGVQIEFTSKTRCVMTIEGLEDKISAEYEIEREDGEWQISIEPTAEKNEMFELDGALFDEGEDSDGKYIEIDGERFYLVD